MVSKSHFRVCFGNSEGDFLLYAALALGRRALFAIKQVGKMQFWHPNIGEFPKKNEIFMCVGNNKLRVISEIYQRGSNLIYTL